MFACIGYSEFTERCWHDDWLHTIQLRFSAVSIDSNKTEAHLILGPFWIEFCLKGFMLEEMIEQGLAHLVLLVSALWGTVFHASAYNTEQWIEQKDSILVFENFRDYDDADRLKRSVDGSGDDDVSRVFTALCSLLRCVLVCSLNCRSKSGRRTKNGFPLPKL